MQPEAGLYTLYDVTYGVRPIYVVLIISPVSVVLCLSISAIASAPLSPTEFILMSSSVSVVLL